jgi:electron transfer flavoprotein-quinone oxidoreductase
LSEKFDVIVVGGGPAGLSSAYFLAKKGLEVVVLERGPEPGSKNVFGGRIYSYVLDKNFPGWRKEAPIERWVRRERLLISCPNSVVTLEYRPLRGLDGGYDSFTAFLSKFVAWLSEKAEESGAMVLTSTKVDEVILKDGFVEGVRVGNEKLVADYVVIAEGVNTLLCERLGIRPKPSLETTAIGVKEVIRLGKDVINERFGLEDWEGVAEFILGYPLLGVAGGGFLYTMKEYVTLGAVVRLSEVRKKKVTVRDLAELMRTHPAVKDLVKGGTLVEYSAHLTREGGLIDVMEKPYGNGYLVVGDAAGFLLNTGFTIRGVDLAIESGRLAAEAIAKAHESGRRDADALSYYKKLLDESIIMKNLREFSKTPELLENVRLYKEYPEIICDVLSAAYTTDEVAKRIYPALRDSMRRHGIGWLKLLSDLWRARGAI